LWLISVGPSCNATHILAKAIFPEASLSRTIHGIVCEIRPRTLPSESDNRQRCIIILWACLYTFAEYRSEYSPNGISRLMLSDCQRITSSTYTVRFSVIYVASAFNSQNHTKLMHNAESKGQQTSSKRPALARVF